MLKTIKVSEDCWRAAKIASAKYGIKIGALVESALATEILQREKEAKK